MGKYDSLKKQLNNSTDRIKTGTNKITSVNTEMRRVADVAHNAEEIINDIDEKFAVATANNCTNTGVIKAGSVDATTDNGSANNYVGYLFGETK